MQWETVYPHVSFSLRKKFLDHMIHGAPPGTLGLAGSSGWVTQELFLECLKLFIKHSGSNKQNPVLLLDNHDSYVSLETVNYC